MNRWTFWQAYKATYAGGATFLLACPLLALIPAAFEMLQHVAEMSVLTRRILAEGVGDRAFTQPRPVAAGQHREAGRRIAVSLDLESLRVL